MRSEVTSHDTSSVRTLDLTDQLRKFTSSNGGDGLVNVFVPHATAGLAVVETGSGTEGDLLDSLERLLPRDDRYRHSHGSRGHGGDHVVPAYVAPSVTIPVVDGEPALGTWQSLVLVDTNVDNPHRKVRWSFVPA
jgi:secondary thiamine-phosphate synthase enzyme